MNTDEVKELAHEVSRETIGEVFKLLGVDIHDVESVNKFRGDLIWIRRYRKASETVGSRVLVTVTTILTGGVVAAIWSYIQTRPS